MANNAANEEIIEKRPSHPVSTACLILAALAVLGALALQITEISQVRARMTPAEKRVPDPYKNLYKKNLKEFKDSVDKLIAENEHLEIVPVEPPGRPGADRSSGDTGASPPAKATGSGASPVSPTPTPTEAEEPSATSGPEETKEEGAAEPPSGETEKEGESTEAAAPPSEGTTEKGEEGAAGEPPPEEPPAEAEPTRGE